MKHEVVKKIVVIVGIIAVVCAAIWLAQNVRSG